MKNIKSLLLLCVLGVILALVCGKKESQAPPLDSLIGYWKWYNISGHAGCGSEDYYVVYWFRDDGTFDFLYWSDSYALIKISDYHSGTWSLDGNQLTIHQEGQTDKVFEIEYSSTSVTLTLVSATPSYTREYKFEEQPWMPVEYRSRFSLPAEDPS